MTPTSRSKPKPATALPEAPPSSQLRSLDWLAARLSLSYWGARDLLLRGEIPIVSLPGKRGKAVRRLLVDQQDVETFIAAHREHRNHVPTPRPQAAL